MADPNQGDQNEDGVQGSEGDRNPPEGGHKDFILGKRMFECPFNRRIHVSVLFSCVDYSAPRNNHTATECSHPLSQADVLVVFIGPGVGKHGVHLPVPVCKEPVSRVDKSVIGGVEYVGLTV